MRIRSIKPEFWRSDDIDALSIPDRLLFIGLWSYVDDSGVGIDKEAAIAADLFAGDLSREPQETSVRVHGGLERLAERGLITRYAVEGRRFLHISKWTDHQKINRPSEARFPGPTSENAEPQPRDGDGSVRAHADAVPGAVEQGSSGITTSAPADAAATMDEGFAEFYAAYPRKEKRPDAKRAYVKAIKKSRFTHEQIMTGLARHQAAWHSLGKARQFVPYPASWLNGECFNDEPTQFGQTVLSAVPDLPTSFEEIRADVDVERAGQLLKRSFVADSKPPSDPTTPEQWFRDRAVEFIDAHEREIRAALTGRQAG